MEVTKIWEDPEIQIFLDLVPSSWPKEASLLSEKEMAYCLQSRHEDLQLCRAQLRLMVKEILEDPQAVVSEGILGRPIVNQEVDISFSHKNGKALVGVTNSPRRLGVDLESLGQKIEWSFFKGHCFQKADEKTISELSQLPGWDSEKAQLCLYSLKEAFFKAVDKPFTPAVLEVTFCGVKQGQPHFEARWKGRLFTQEECRLFVVATASEIVSVCCLRNPHVVL